MEVIRWLGDHVEIVFYLCMIFYGLSLFFVVAFIRR